MVPNYIYRMYFSGIAQNSLFKNCHKKENILLTLLFFQKPVPEHADGYIFNANFN